MIAVSAEEDPSAGFEVKNWRQARASLKKNNEDNSKLQLFLQSTTDGKDVKSECLKLKRISENKYQQGLGGVLENIDALMNLGDIGMKFAPESVGLAWMGIRMCLRGVQGDWATFQLFSGACADIIGIMISCRVYGKMYSDNKDAPKSFAELHEKVVDYIPQIYTDILEFSYAVFRYTQKRTIIRIGSHIFKDIKGGFEGQINGIKASDLKMREFARTASERMLMHLQRENLQGQTRMQSQLVSLQETLDVSLKANETIVRHLVEEMEEERKNTRKKTPYEKAQDEYEENMGHLDGTEIQYELLQENLDVLREPDTCRWIFNLEQYRKWKDSPQSSIVWVSGEGGFGKSIVISTVIEELQTQHTDDSKTMVQYFFCKAGMSGTQDTDQILRSVVAHLYERCQTSPDLLERANEAINKGLGKKAKTKTIKFNFQTAYSGLLQAMDRDVFLVIDALDECADRQEQHFIQSLRTIVATTGTRIRMMVCSRPKADIESDLHDISNIKCEDNNKPDIEKSITTQMRGFPGWTKSEKRYAVERIVLKAGGQFKFVQVALDFLRKPLVRPFEPIIDSLPNGLAGSYITSWHATNPDYRELLKTALTWTLFADGSAPVPVIMDAYSRTYSPEAGIKYEKVKEQHRGSQVVAPKMDLHERQIRIAGGQFLEVLSSGHVTLRHLTVRDFFVPGRENTTNAKEHDALQRSASVRAISDEAPWTISAKEGHMKILKVLLQNLTSSAFQKKYLMPHAQEGQFSGLEWREPSDDEFEEEQDEEPQAEEQEEEEQREGSTVNQAVEQKTELNKQSSEEDSKQDVEKEQDKNGMTEFTDSSGVPPSQDEGETGTIPIKSRTSSIDSRSDVETWKDFEHLYIPDEPDFTSDKLVDYASDSSREELDDNSSEAVFGEGLMACKQYRYELTHWFYHLREAQALWSPEEQQSEADWEYVWEKLLKFTRKQRRAFQAWLRLLCHHDGSVPYQNICRANPLHIASYLGLSSLVRKLIADGYDVQQPCFRLTRFRRNPKFYLRPLDLAVSSHETDAETIKLLVNHGADLNVTNMSLVNSCNPFHLAVFKQPSKDFIEYLLAHGGDPSVRDRRARTAIHHFSYAGFDPEALRLLVDARPDTDIINLVSSYSHQTPLHVLVNRRNNLPLELLKAYLEAKADVNLEDENSMRPLHKLALYGNATAVKLLIDYGADVHDVDYRGQTAFHAAAQFGNAQTLEALALKGAKMNLTDAKGRTPFFLACMNDNQETAMYLIEKLDGEPEAVINKADDRGSTPLREAASTGNASIIELLLSKASSPAEAIDAKDRTYQQNSLHKAAIKGRRAALEVLIEHGGDLSLKDKNSLTPFQLCAKFWTESREESVPLEDTLCFLIEQKAPPTTALNNLMFTTATRGSIKITESLISVGANPKIEDAHGWTPAMFAQHYGQHAIVDLLAKQSKSSGKRPSGWADMGQRIAISNDRLQVRSVGPNFYGKTVVSNHPTPATNTKYYFEVKIGYDETVEKNPKIDERLVIGLTTLPAVLTAACLTRDWTVEDKEYSFKKSYGFAPTQNVLHAFGAGYPQGPRNIQREKGDIVGCGIDYARKIVFFTNNGQRFEEKYDFTNIPGRVYYPAVSIEGRYIAKANFGGKKFRWEGWKAWSKGL